MQTVLRFEHASFRKNNQLVFENLNWEIKKDENWAITGSSGSGKTTLLEILKGNYVQSAGTVWNHLGLQAESGITEVGKHVAFVFFQDHEMDYQNYYYQQRYNSTEVAGTLTVNAYLTGRNRTAQTGTISDLNIESLLDKEVIKLSNGETRRILLAKAILKNPRLLVLDNPYIGLDVKARKILNNMIDKLCSMGTQVIMVGDSSVLPENITHIMNLEDMHVESFGSNNSQSRLPSDKISFPVITFPEPGYNKFETAIKFSEVTVAYEKILLNRVNWTILRNEKWALTGHNGAGKSMLLSLIYADNPQSYANDIVLFDHRRGQGESIWDIKERIGFVSPELHFYFDKKQTCHEAVIGSLFEHPYKKTEIHEEQVDMLHFLFRYYQIEHLRETRMEKISTGQQRLVLFLRVLMKNPPLLLLDEPFQGFDEEMVERSKALLDRYCQNRTVLFVSHKPEETPSCVTHFAELKQGVLHLP